MENILPVDKIITTFFDLSGETEADKWRNHCATSAVSIIAMLKPGIDVATDEWKLCYAAACMAFYRYVLSGAAEGITVLKAGDVTVNTSSDNAVTYARSLLEDALMPIGSLLIPKGFAFHAT